jgi:cell shape-determining protein MreC
MPVTDGAGLIGKVTKVYPDQSVVLLITDPQYAVQAQVLSRVDDEESSSTSSSAPSNTALSGRSLDSTTTTSATTTTTTTPSSTTTTIPVFGATPGETTTAPSTSTTTTLPGFKVRRETGTVTGQSADRPLLFSLIEETALTNVKVGDIVETAGGTKSLAPQSIPIGTITAVSHQPGSRSPIVEVAPNASLNQLNFVSVVLFVPNQAAI